MQHAAGAVVPRDPLGEMESGEGWGRIYWGKKLQQFCRGAENLREIIFFSYFFVPHNVFIKPTHKHRQRIRFFLSFYQNLSASPGGGGFSDPAPVFPAILFTLVLSNPEWGSVFAFV